ncbi:MAG: hypothetical protein ACT4PP_15865 [Sporichthyaceae bacterium]
MRQCSIASLAEVVAQVHSWEADFVRAQPGPLQFGPSAAAMDLAWSLDDEHGRILGEIRGLRAAMERELVHLQAGGDVGPHSFAQVPVRTDASTRSGGVAFKGVSSGEEAAPRRGAGPGQSGGRDV